MNRRTVLQRAFDAEVEQWITTALAQGPCSFADLLFRLPGVYPCTALKAIGRMRRNRHIDPVHAAALTLDASAAPNPATAPADVLPLPHPLDFEWRFAADSSKRMLSIAQLLTRPDDPILLFGTPGVATAAIATPLDRPVIFLGEDNAVSHAVAALNGIADEPVIVNILSSAQRVPGSAGVVVVDPPWYLDFLRPMLAAASSACRCGGNVVLSLMPEGTRPGARRDRDRVMELLRRFGLHPVDTLTDALRYETPFFESNALAAGGIRGIPPHWRRSDLVVLRKLTDHGPPLALVPRERLWHEVAINRMRLFISRVSSTAAQQRGALGSIVPGDILPTVSRRDPRRRKVQVWTSGNRIFRTDRPELVLAAAHYVAKDWRLP